MIKISNQDICNALKAKDGQDWRFGFGWFILPVPCFYVKGKSVNDCVHEYNTQIPFTVRYENTIDEYSVERIFNNFDWAKAYKTMFDRRVHFGDDLHKDCKAVRYKDDKFSFYIILADRVVEALESLMTKTAEKPEKTKKSDEGRGGK